MGDRQRVRCRACIPEPDGRVRTHGRERATAGGERHLPYAVAMMAEQVAQDARGRVPEAEAVIGRRSGERSSVGREREQADESSRVLAEREPLTPGCDVPRHDAAHLARTRARVARGQDHGPSIGRERDLDHIIALGSGDGEHPSLAGGLPIEETDFGGAAVERERDRPPIG